MKNILITGASGFVGKNLLTYFRNDGNKKLVTISRQDLNNIDESSLKNIDVVIHLAGKAHDLKQTSSPQEYYDVNYELTKKLYTHFIDSDASKFIFISSVKAAADEVFDILTEEHVPNPVTDYGKSKLMAENHIITQSLPPGKTFYILRPCMIHGPGNKGNLNLLYKFVKRGIPYPLAAFNNKRSYLSVENLCFIINEITDRLDIDSGIYNLSDDKTMSTSEVISILAGSLGQQPRLIALPKFLITFIARLGDKLRLPLNTERLNKLTENYIVSNSKISNAINKPLPLTAKYGLQSTAKSFGK